MVNTSCYIRDDREKILRRLEAPSFHYSDGDDVEHALYDTLSKTGDLSVHSDRLRESQVDWPTTYYLSEKRSNLLRPMEDFLRNARVLELGCGCGAVTRYLAETADEVVAVDGSARRASIAAQRCRDCENTTIISDTIQNLPESLGRFDVVTLIGVLEYSRVYGGADAESAVLRKARTFLRPGGVLVLAIENKLGLKYLSGVPEDHLGSSWTGVMGAYAEDGVQTWSRKELCDMLHHAGFSRPRQFVPIPDYKLPTSIIHPEGLAAADAGTLRLESLLAMRPRPYEVRPLFNIAQTWESVCKAGLLADMTDSLCFTAVNWEEGGATDVWSSDILVSHYGSAPAKRYVKEMRIERENGTLVVKRRHIYPGLQDANAPFMQILIDEPYLQGTLIFDRIRRVMLRRGWTSKQLADALRPWTDWLVSKYETDENAAFECIDAGPINMVLMDDGSVACIDQEWRSKEPMPILSVLLRSLFMAYVMVGPVAAPAKDSQTNFWSLTRELLRHLDIAFDHKELKNFLEKAMELDRFLSGAEKASSMLKLSDVYNPPRICENTNEIYAFQEKLRKLRASRLWQLAKPLRILASFVRGRF
jgi:2-polyprenyl-3-methyl-5-hydroxy-6-metoxy-1,4-benzoquinol methylase